MEPSIPFYHPADAIKLRQFKIAAGVGAAAAVCSGALSQVTPRCANVQGPSLKHQVYVQAAPSHICSSKSHVQASSIKF